MALDFLLLQALPQKEGNLETSGKVGRSSREFKLVVYSFVQK
jgi:hypothetical protein